MKNGTYSFNEYGVVGLCNGGVDGHSLFSNLVAIQGVALEMMEDWDNWTSELILKTFCSHETGGTLVRCTYYPC